jgi:hypothetical protein
MRFSRGTHSCCCGIDLHARAMYVCLIDHQGTTPVEQNLRCDPAAFLRAVAPYKHDLVVTAECVFCWYWLADLCTHHGITFVLTHELYLKAIHGAKAKNDPVDASKLVMLLRGGVIPVAYVYPPDMTSRRRRFPHQPGRTRPLRLCRQEMHALPSRRRRLRVRAWAHSESRLPTPTLSFLPPWAGSRIGRDEPRLH